MSDVDVFMKFMNEISIEHTSHDAFAKPMNGRTDETFTQSEIDRMDMDRASNTRARVERARPKQRITNETERSQFAGPTRPARPTRGAGRKIDSRNYCDECDMIMEKDQFDNGLTGYVCGKCGKQGEYCYENVIDASDLLSTGNESSNYNTSSGSSIPLTIMGPGGKAQKRGIISNNASYKKTQERTTRSQIQNTLSGTDSGQRIPEDIIRDAANLFLHIQEKKIILRGGRRRGTMAACLDRKCRQRGLPRKCGEIARMFQIDRETLSVGHRILDGFLENGIIGGDEINFKDYDGEIEIIGYINRYFKSLGIPLDDGHGNYGDMSVDFMEEKAAGGLEHIDAFSGKNGHPNYKQFSLDLINFTRQFKIADTSMDSSKCAGVIYIVAMRFSELKISTENIERECDISKSTFCKFSREVDKILNTDEEHSQKCKRKLHHLFKKYDIPWR
jgi:Transcription factor TFIIB repeat